MCLTLCCWHSVPHGCEPDLLESSPRVVVARQHAGFVRTDQLLSEEEADGHNYTGPKCFRYVVVAPDECLEPE